MSGNDSDQAADDNMQEIEDIYCHKDCVLLLLQAYLLASQTVCTYTLLSVGIQPSS